MECLSVMKKAMIALHPFDNFQVRVLCVNSQKYQVPGRRIRPEGRGGPWILNKKGIERVLEGRSQFVNGRDVTLISGLPEFSQ